MKKYKCKWDDGIYCIVNAMTKKEAFNYIYHCYGDKVKFTLTRV